MFCHADSIDVSGGKETMTYIENIFICLAIPMLLSAFFVKRKVRSFTFFVIIGMGICLLSAYVNSFFMGLSGADLTAASIDITPVCEEVIYFR